MKKIIMAAVVSLLPITAFADGHSKIWNMAGLGNAPSSSKMMEGKTGSIMINSSTDLWDWSEAPEGFPTLVTARMQLNCSTDCSGGTVRRRWRL